MVTKKTHHAPLLMRGTAEGGGEVYRANCALLVRTYGTELLGREHVCRDWQYVRRLQPIEDNVRALREALPVAARIARATNDGELLDAGRAVRDWLREYDADACKRKKSFTMARSEWLARERDELKRARACKPLRELSLMYETTEKSW